MEDTHVYFINPVLPTPRSEPSELQNLHRNSAAGQRQKNSQRHYGMDGFPSQLTRGSGSIVSSLVGSVAKPRPETHLAYKATERSFCAYMLIL